MVNRREFLKGISCRAWVAALAGTRCDTSRAASGKAFGEWIDHDTARSWRARWEDSILGQSTNHRYCDTEMGEQLGWLVSPFLDGFYYGYLATHDSNWVKRLVDWADSCIRRAVKEPDGYPGWPKVSSETMGFDADNMLGEAMMLRPMVLMADVILKTPALDSKWGGKAHAYLEWAERTFEKWDSRDAWRDCPAGGLWVAQYFGIDAATGRWTPGFVRRKSEAFSHPANKESLIALWLMALSDVTGKPVYRQRCEKWWQLLKSRMRTRNDGRYWVWDYWDPAGPWDYNPDGSTKHWVGVHPNGGYYEIDVQGAVAAFDHHLVFGQEDVDRLIATNRDFMWNHRVGKAQFQRIDGGPPDPRWANTPGVLWNALVPYDATLRKVFVANHQPDSWGGLRTTPWFLSLASQH